MSGHYRRYPVEKEEYDKSVGKLLPHRIGQILKELGFRTQIFEVEENGVDIKVFDNDNRLILVGEIINWSIGSYLNNSRITKIINNLSEYQCKRVLVYAAPRGEHLLEDLGSYSISKLKIGYQLLPKYFYDHYAKRGQVFLREIDSRITRQDIKTKIVEFLQSSAIEITANILTEAPVQTN
jgi:hypothetical protein